MELDSQALKRVWWKGAINSAIKGIPLGLLSGLAAAVLLSFVIVPMVPALAPVFGSFLTMPGISASFFPVPLLLFNTAITMAANFFTGGKIACNAYKQDVQHRMNEVRIDQIEARELALEQTVASPSRHVQRIVAQGPRAQQSFASAEQARGEAPSSPTLH